MQEFFRELFGWKTEPFGAMINTPSQSRITGHFTQLGHELHHYVTVYVEVDDPQARLDMVEDAGRPNSGPASGSPRRRPLCMAERL